jgi:hypothetical protein
VRRSRARISLAVSIALVIALGLGSRAFPFLLPVALGKYPGDALWALMIFFGVAFLKPDISTQRLCLIALTICWLVEFSQLYQAPWLNSIRAAKLGHLLLGSKFHTLDLVAYAVGVLVGLVADACFFNRKSPPPRV